MKWSILPGVFIWYSMALVLTTHPLLHRRFFRTARRRLEGKEVLIFSAAEYELNRATTAALKEHVTTWSKTAARILLTTILLASITIVGSFVLPEAYAKLFPESIAEVTTQAPISTPAPVVAEVKKYEPPFDPSLPQGTWITIPKIGVETEAQATVDPNEALATGVWMVPDFGVPSPDQSDPIIMAAHRFGWKWWWQDDYWKKHSFYLLTDTQPGDTIEIVYNQRKWTYEIYAGEEGTEITDYDADLILYTCKFLNSPIRYFRYARLVEDTASLDTSASDSLTQIPSATAPVVQ